MSVFFFFFQAEDGIRDFCLSRGLGDVYKRQVRDGEQRRHDEEEREQDGQQHDDRAGEIALLFHPSTSFPK